MLFSVPRYKLKAERGSQNMVQIAYTLPYIEEDNDLFERIFSLLPGGPTKTPLQATPTDHVIPQSTPDDNAEEDDVVSRELKLQRKIDALQAQRGSINKGAIREKRRMKKQEKKLEAKKKSLSGKKEKAPKDPELKKNSKKGPTAEASDQLLFGGIATESQSKKKRKTITGLHGKNYKQLLSKVERNDEEIKKLEAVDEDAAKDALQEKRWKAALDRASGQKVKDNPELLKKALKRKEKLKDKRKKAWEERKENVEEKVKRKQARRERNLQKRKDSKKQTKLKKALKKGRVIPTSKS